MEERTVSYQDWVENFARQQERPPRILHIGNIANNAYVNSKLLNENGCDSDVLCYDYYHIMAYPEWEDADFVGQPRSHFYPNWSDVKMRPFRRPKWFAQGPLELSIRYLMARRTGSRVKQLLFWLDLEAWRWVHSRFPGRIATAYEAFLRVRTPRRVAKKLKSLAKRLTPPKLWTALKRLGRPAAAGPTVAVAGAVTADHLNPFVQELIADFKRRFPDRKDQLTYPDTYEVLAYADQLKPLFSHYDIIHAYSTDVVYPMITRVAAYVAYEHGTIREIPFEDSNFSRLTALGFARANAVFMTNADSVPQCRFLQNGLEKVVFGIHGYDERRLYRRLAHRYSLPQGKFRFGQGESVKIFFSPARHDWAVKGNDRFLRAAGEIHRRYAGQFKIVLVEWGMETARSKALISELGLDSAVIWIDPIGKSQLLTAYREVDAVVDQFIMPCIGGVTIEALAIGQSVVLTALDQAAMTEFYGEPIPLLNCQSELEIAGRMEEVLKSPDKCLRVREACLDWMNRHHTHSILLDELATAYTIALP